MEELRARIRAIERNPAVAWEGGAGSSRRTPTSTLLPRGAEKPGQSSRTCPRPRPIFSAPFSPQDAAWTLGEPAFDDLLPNGGLDPAAVHEIKPAAHGDWPAVLAFATSLAARRRLGDGNGAAVLWCLTSRFSAEQGNVLAQGLSELGLAADDLILVEAARESDVLWALEEALRSGALSLVIGVLKSVDLTPARRLGLAAAAARTPALLLTHPASAPTPATALRLRLHRLPSGPHSFDPRAPGPWRLGLDIERCRGAPVAEPGVSLALEWCDDTYRFRMVPSMADRVPASAGAEGRARG